MHLLDIDALHRPGDPVNKSNRARLLIAGLSLPDAAAWAVRRVESASRFSLRKRERRLLLRSAGWAIAAILREEMQRVDFRASHRIPDPEPQ
jgi:hypothetical protein